MSEARTQILTSIRRSLKRDTVKSRDDFSGGYGLKDHARNLVPERSRLSPSDRSICSSPWRRRSRHGRTHPQPPACPMRWPIIWPARTCRRR